MKRPYIIALVVLVLIIGGIGLYAVTHLSTISQNSKTTNPVVASNTPAPTSTQTPTPSPPSQQTTQYTLATVAQHNTASDCWTAIDGKVYNITSFIPNHPGGQAIIKACGKNATTLFHSVGTHTVMNAQATLDKYFIGNLQ